jgi:hypothetical protein
MASALTNRILERPQRLIAMACKGSLYLTTTSAASPPPATPSPRQFSLAGAMRRIVANPLVDRVPVMIGGVARKSGTSFTPNERADSPCQRRLIASVTAESKETV